MNDPKKMHRIKSATFIAGSPNLTQLPEREISEIAFIGRSNTGKSTLINRLANQKGLARASSTPGRTQEINLFHFTILDPQDAKVEIMLADLPGFGFAKFGKSKRREMSRLVVDYISEREALHTVCLLNDSRRTPGEDELAVQRLAFASGRFVQVIVTKCDKLSKNELKKQLDLISKAYHLEPKDMLLTGEKYPVEALWPRLLAI